MKKAVLIHNPTAGAGDHKKTDLVKIIASGGYEVEYFSTDLPGWKHFSRHKPDVIFIAGGDGTVQKLTAEMLKAGAPVQNIPVQVLPLGTANNIATTLKLNIPLEKLVDLENTVSFDIGEVEGAGEANFFIEGIGFGIFPKLVKTMKEKKEEEKEPGDTDAELKLSLQELQKLVNSYEACDAIIIADGEEITGKFLLVELMNIRFIGPNFELAPHANTGDGYFELVAIPEDSRKDLEKYIQDMLKNNNKTSLKDFALLKKVKKVRLKWFGKDVHIDDERIENYKENEINVKNKNAAFNFRIE